MSEKYWRKLLIQDAEKYWNNVISIKTFLIQNRGYVLEIPYDEPIILLYSGGMDSTVLIDIVIRKWNCKVILIYFRRNAKNQQWEEKSFDIFYKFYQERFPNNILEMIKLDIEIPSRMNKEYLSRERQKIFGLPLRNSIMWDNAFTQAVYLSGKYNTTIRSILVGSVKEDETSPESGILSILSHNLSTCIALGIWYYQLLAPFLDGTLEKSYSKVDILKYAQEYKIPIENSRSCFEAGEEPCNKCLACENRNKAYTQLSKI